MKKKKKKKALPYRIPTNKCRKKNGIRKSPFCRNHSNNQFRQEIPTDTESNG